MWQWLDVVIGIVGSILLILIIFIFCRKGKNIKPKRILTIGILEKITKNREIDNNIEAILSFNVIKEDGTTFHIKVKDLFTKEGFNNLKINNIYPLSYKEKDIYAKLENEIDQDLVNNLLNKYKEKNNINT